MKALANTILAIFIFIIIAIALFLIQGSRNPLCQPALIVGFPDNRPQEIIARIIDEDGGLPQVDADLDAPDPKRAIIPVTEWRIRSAVLTNSSASFIAALRDDDPVMHYTIDLDISWEDGASGIVQWRAWRYGLVSCPLVISRGSGPTGRVRIIELTPAPPENADDAEKADLRR